MSVPGPWAGVLLALFTYRVLRLVILDSITDPFRERFIDPGPRWLVTLFECPWCMGWWISLAVFSAYEVWPHGTLVVAVPFALSAAAGIIGKNLDS